MSPDHGWLSQQVNKKKIPVRKNAQTTEVVNGLRRKRNQNKK